jgi:hypothetical protein
VVTAGGVLSLGFVLAGATVYGAGIAGVSLIPGVLAFATDTYADFSTIGSERSAYVTPLAPKC